MGQSQGMKTNRAVRLLCLALAMILISCIGASALQTDFGKVQVYTIKLPVDGGKWISANIFKPKSATPQSPAPLVVASHGGANNKEMQDLPAIELSRRGIVVISIDRYFHGESSPADVALAATMSGEVTAMIPMVEYGWGLDYVDSSKVGVTGHSMGGGSSWNTMRYFGKQYMQALEDAKATSSDGGAEVTTAELATAQELNKVSAGFPTSMSSMATTEMLADIYANVGVNQGQFDEAGYGRPNKNSVILPTDAEALAVIRSIDPNATSMEMNTYYGNAEDKTLRVFYNPAEIHPWQHFSSASASHVVSFFETAFSTSSGIAPEQQVWFVKELFNLLGLLGAFLFIIPCAVLLLKVPCFAGLSKTVPEALPSLSTRKSKFVFWGGWCLGWLVSFASFVPLASKVNIFADPYEAYNWFLSALTINFILPWAIFNGVFGLLWFWVAYRWLGGKEGGTTQQMWGVQIGLRDFAKTVALAICIFAGFYGLVFLADYFFHTDFRIWFMAAKPFGSDKLLIALPYILFFFIYYAANALLTNGANRIQGQKEWVNLLICGSGNVLGILLLEIVQYGTLFTTGSVLWTDWLAVLVLMPLIFQLFVAAYINRYLFKETGNIWLGAMVNCIIIVTMGVTNTAIVTQLVR